MAQLIFQTAFIGDALLSVPLIKNLRRLYPSEDIEIVCRPLVADFLEDIGLVNKAYGLDKTRKKSWQDLKAQVKGRKFSRVFCPHESLRSALFVRSLAAREKVGYRQWWNRWAFDHRVLRPMEFPEALRQIYLLSPLHADIAEHFVKWRSSSTHFNPDTQDIFRAGGDAIPEWASMKCDMPIDKVKSFQEKFNLGGDYICIAPGSVWATKKWPVEKFRQLALRYSDLNFKVVTVGSPQETELCEEALRGVGNSLNLAGRTNLTSLACVLSGAKCLVGNDSGTMHLACVAGTPVVSVFGPTTLSLGYRPWQERAVVVQKPLSCRPCGLHGHKKCPIGTHDCMNKVSVDDVFRESRAATF